MAWYSHVVDAACWADDYRLAATEQQARARLLHRCLKSANNMDPRVAHGLDEVIHLENEVASATLGTEEGGQRLFKQVEVVLRLQLRLDFQDHCFSSNRSTHNTKGTKPLTHSIILIADATKGSALTKCHAAAIRPLAVELCSGS